MGRGDIEAARIVGRFVVLRCAGKEEMRAARDNGVGEARAGWVSRRKGRARRALGGMERGGGAYARSPCACSANLRFARLRRQRGNAGGAGYGVGEARAG